jgi:hypothetical protein
MSLDVFFNFGWILECTNYYLTQLHSALVKRSDSLGRQEYKAQNSAQVVDNAVEYICMHELVVSPRSLQQLDSYLNYMLVKFNSYMSDAHNNLASMLNDRHQTTSASSMWLDCLNSLC